MFHGPELSFVNRQVMDARHRFVTPTPKHLMADPDHPGDCLKKGLSHQSEETPRQVTSHVCPANRHSIQPRCFLRIVSGGFTIPAPRNDCYVNRSSSTDRPQVGFATNAGAGPTRSGLMAVISPASMAGVSSTCRSG